MSVPSYQPDNVEIAVQTRVLGCGSSSINVRLPAGPIRVSDLIRAKIEAEWAAGGAVGRESAEPEVLSGGLAAWQSLVAAVRHACDGHRAGWYVILIDGQPTTGLDEVIFLDPRSCVVFVRMCPLPDR